MLGSNPYKAYRPMCGRRACRSREDRRPVARVPQIRSGAQSRDVSGARTMKRVLVVDDEPTIAQLLKEAFGSFRHGHAYEVEIAHDGAEALMALLMSKFDLLVVDMYMPRMDGLELLTQMRTHDVRVPVLMVTGNQSAQAAADAISAKIFAYIPKPLDLVQLDHIVALALSTSRTVAGSTSVA